jgi:hypothetical protein
VALSPLNTTTRGASVTLPTSTTGVLTVAVVLPLLALLGAHCNIHTPLTHVALATTPHSNGGAPAHTSGEGDEREGEGDDDGECDGVAEAPSDGDDDAKAVENAVADALAVAVGDCVPLSDALAVLDELAPNDSDAVGVRVGDGVVLSLGSGSQ